MPLPETFEYARDRICELLISGSGERAIATGSVSLEEAYPGVEPEEMATAAKHLPQAVIEFQSFPNPNANLNPANVTFYNIDCSIVIYRSLDSEQVKYWRYKTESDLEALAHEVRQVLEYPGNVELKDDGTETGLISSLSYVSFDKELDWPNKLGIGTITFSGQAVLLNKS